MLPLRDDIPSSRKPIGLRVILAVNTALFVYELGLSGPELQRLFMTLGVVPARYTNEAFMVWMSFPDLGAIPFFSHMFLHAGWFHFVVNMWILFIFGDNVEDVMGPVRFVLFYLLCGLLALGAHFVFNHDSAAPVIGASGAIAGVMGAYLLLYPKAKVLTLIPIFIFPYVTELPAVLFLGIWFFLQLLSGVFSHVAAEPGGVAWWAHAGGFVAGMLLLPFFRRAG